MPKLITCTSGNTITYVHDAAGNKLRVTYHNKPEDIMTKMEYVGNKVYNNGTLSMILTGEGYVALSGNEPPTYHHYLRDHQGNNRVVMGQAGTVLQVNHYYPFGGLFGEGIQTSKQRYRYNGKELDRLFGLDLYDYGARHYDAALGRWLTQDPLAEKYYSISPYVYVANNPVRFIDLTGMDIWEVDNEGRIRNRIKDKTQDAFYMVAKIEYGLINTQNDGSTVMTNHNETSVSASATAQEMDDKGQTVASVVHNHPEPYSINPSGFRPKDKSGDKFAARMFVPNAERYVYQNGKLVAYDGESVIGTISWGLFFQPSTARKHPIYPIRQYPGAGLPPP